ncbi:MAG: hypothetical protein ACOCP8_01595 [archaeon]
MKMNIKNFRKLLNKASIGYLIPSVSLNFDGNKLHSKQISSDNNSIVFLNLPDDILENENGEEFQLNFSDISTNVKPYLDLIKDEVVDVKFNDDFIIIEDSEKKKMKLFFCSLEFTNYFSRKDKTKQYTPFYETNLTNDLLTKISEIRKIAQRFGKIYLVTKNGKIYLEATDKTNNYCNDLSIEIDDINTDKEISLYFDFKNLQYILSTIKYESDEVENFKLKCVYHEEHQAGMMFFENNEKEKYVITSKNE